MYSAPDGVVVVSLITASRETLSCVILYLQCSCYLTYTFRTRRRQNENVFYAFKVFAIAFSAFQWIHLFCVEFKIRIISHGNLRNSSFTLLPLFLTFQSFRRFFFFTFAFMVFPILSVRCCRRRCIFSSSFSYSTVNLWSDFIVSFYFGRKNIHFTLVCSLKDETRTKWGIFTMRITKCWAESLSNEMCRRIHEKENFNFLSPPFPSQVDRVLFPSLHLTI